MCEMSNSLKSNSIIQIQIKKKKSKILLIYLHKYLKIVKLNY